MGHASLTPQDLWKKRQDDPRRTHPPIDMASREAMATVKNETMKIVSSSKECKQMMKNHAQLKLQYSKSALTSSSSHQKLASSRSCAAIATKRKQDDFNSDNEMSTEAFLLSSKDTCKTGTPANPKSELIMILFKTHTENIDAIRRLHFDAC